PPAVPVAEIDLLEVGVELSGGKVVVSAVEILVEERDLARACGVDDGERGRRGEKSGVVGLLLLVQQVVVESRRPPDRLARIVDDEVEAVVAVHDLATERLDARRVPEVDAVNRQPVAPVGEIGLARVAARGVAWEARRHDYAGAGAEE